MIWIDNYQTTALKLSRFNIGNYIQKYGNVR